MLICEWRGRECRSNCITTVPWAKLWTKACVYMVLLFCNRKMMKRLSPPISMRPNHTQRNRKCLHLENLFLCFSAPLLLCGLLPFQSAVLGHGSLQQQQQQKRSAVVEWSAYMRSSNKRTMRACRTVLMGWGKSLRLWASLWGIWSLLDIFGFFFLFGALDSASTLEGGCV